ncbi:unnamed protein product [Prunus armeniaca]
MAFEETWARFMRYGESAVRGRLVIDMDDMHPLEFPKEFEVEGDLLFSSGAVHEAHVSSFYWVDGLSVCQASTPCMCAM